MTTYRLEDLPPELASRIKINPVTGCWEWQHRRAGDNPMVYGSILWNGQFWSIHRLTYTLMISSIPPGLVIDHVYARGCRAKSCCNPAHLEAVTKEEDLWRRRLANRKTGIAQTVLKRLADGTTTEHDLAVLGPALPWAPGRKKAANV